MAPRAQGRRPAKQTESRFFLITHTSQEEGNRLWRAACDRRGVEYVEAVAEEIDYGELADAVAPQDMVYRAAATIAAVRLEQWLIVQGAKSYYPKPERVFFNCVNSTLLFQSKGVPTVRTVYDLVHDREILLRYVDSLGGFPVVVKVLGSYQGQGVVRVDTLPALYALVDFVLFAGLHAYLMAYVPHARYRVVVLDGAAIASTRHVPAADDFRAGVDGGQPVSRLPRRIRELAFKATEIMQTRLAGVDVLADTRSDALYVSAANFPFVFAPTQTISGVDIAGKALDYLLQKRR